MAFGIDPLSPNPILMHLTIYICNKVAWLGLIKLMNTIDFKNNLRERHLQVTWSIFLIFLKVLPFMANSLYLLKISLCIISLFLWKHKTLPLHIDGSVCQRSSLSQMCKTRSKNSLSFISSHRFCLILLTCMATTL